MATITGLTAARMLAIEAASIIDGDIVGDNLILTKHDASTINAGNVRGPAGTNATPFALVNALPGSPTDGQEIFFQNAAMAALGVIWHLRYRSAASGSYKWEAVGCVPHYHNMVTDGARGTTATTYGDVSGGAGPTVTVPLAGEYWTDVSCDAYPWAGNQSLFMSYQIGATAAQDTDAAFSDYIVATGKPLWRRKFKTFTAGTVLLAKYKGTGNPLEKNFSNRFLGITPIRVG